MRFDDSGMFWEPFKYVAKTRVSAVDKAPRVAPPIPETGWCARAHFPDLSAAKSISLDTETYDPDLLTKGPGPRRDGYIAGVSLATDDGFSIYYPVAHSMGENLDREPVMRYLRDQLGRPEQPKVGANLLYDIDFLDAAGVAVRGSLYDVLYADPLIYEYEYSYSLNSVAKRRIGLEKETSLLYQWCADAYGGDPDEKQRANIWRSPASLVGPYAEQDAVLPLKILRAQMVDIRAMGLVDIFRMECDLIPLLLRMRKGGVRVDLAKVNALDCELTTKIELLEKQINLNPDSSDEIRRMCDLEGIEYPYTAPTSRFPNGQPSFTKEWIADNPHPKLVAISELRKLRKLRDTFVRGAILGSHINGRIHCEFHPLRSDDYGTVSGRYSSSHPNLQQIPIRDEYWGPRIRACFIPDEDHDWLKNDLSQIEFRLGTHYGIGASAERAREQYRNDPKTDFYNLASSMTGLARPESKSLSLGSLYGMGKPKFCRKIKRSLEEGGAIFDQFHDNMPFIRDTYKAFGDEARQWGHVKTIGGRVCHLDSGFEHKALNRKLQGSCADWIKRAMLLAYKGGIFDELIPYLTVHDEKDCGMRKGSPVAKEAARELHQIMCTAYKLTIPVLAGFETGPSWGELNEVA